MKLYVFSLVIALSAVTHAQSMDYSRANYLKKARVQMEKENEQKILEMLETQRLKEEQARMERISNISFGVVAPEANQNTTVQF